MIIDANQITAITHVYAIYARAIDEKRYDLIERVFAPTATLRYVVGPHEFSCTGAEAAAAFGEFLEWCYWTNHLIGAPMVERRNGAVFATARVQASHLQRRLDGTLSRWLVRGSYHDHFAEQDGQWRITDRVCICKDEDGEFVDSGVERFPTLAWSEPSEVSLRAAAG